MGAKYLIIIIVIMFSLTLTACNGWRNGHLVEKQDGFVFYYEPVLHCYILNDGTEYHGPFNTYGEAYDNMPSHDLLKGYSLWGERINDGVERYYWSFKEK